MKIFAVLLLTLVVTTESKLFDVPEFPRFELISDEIIKFVNNVANTTWKAAKIFDSLTPQSIKNMMGLLKDITKIIPVVKIEIATGLPKNFDAREKWPHCPTIGQIKDQGSCGACWAVSGAGAMSDRLCIHSNGAVKVELSYEDLVTCCGHECGGCDGGYMEDAWQYFIDKGLVTGGNYNTSDTCRPYTTPGCHGKNEKCEKGVILPTPKCVEECEGGYKTEYQQDKYFGKETYAIENDMEQIMSEIYKNGPVQASLTAYKDLLNYQSGVYQHVVNEIKGDHAVRILGWGVENDVPYWLASNSWNVQWGEKGFWKILRGTNESEIESEIVAGMPKILSTKPFTVTL